MEKLNYGPYSPSLLDAGVCGYQFERLYANPDKKVERTENLPQARGSAVHEVFERITARMCKEKNANFSKQEIHEWVEEAVNNHPVAYEEIGEIIDMAQRYIRKPPPVLTEDAGIEMHLAVKLKGFDSENNPIFEDCAYTDPDAFGRGKADVLIFSDDTTSAIVYDHKTQMNVEEADTFQLGFYAWVISKHYPFLEEIQTVLHFARYGTYSEAYTWTRSDLEKIEDEIMTRVSIIENRTDWSPVPNSKCIYCPFIAECPSWRDHVMVDEATGQIVTKKKEDLRIIGNTHKATEIAGLLNVLDQVEKVCKEELREHVKQYGPIAIPGKVYEYRGAEKINWDKINKKMKEEIMEIFRKHDVDPTKFMGFSQTLSSHVWMYDKPELVKELSQAMPRKTETKFSGYKS